MNMVESDIVAERLSALPAIRRCRGSRLYAADGRRVLDLYAEGGRCALGRKRGSVGTLTKALLDTGLVSGFPSPWSMRLQRQIAEWIPGFESVFIYDTEKDAQKAARSVLPEGVEPATEIAFGTFRDDTARPGFSPSGKASVMLAIMPLAKALACGVLAIRPGSLPQTSLETLTSLTSPVAPFKLAASQRALADYRAISMSACEAGWKKIDRYLGGRFRRSGPWLYPLYSAERHEEVFRACLERDILISPDFGTPSFLPLDFDKGEIAPLGFLKLSF